MTVHDHRWPDALLTEDEVLRQYEAALDAAEQHARNLELALKTARVIGQATGIVMATYKLPADDAFRVLIRLSQHGHRKVRDVAERVCETGDIPGA